MTQIIDRRNGNDELAMSSGGAIEQAIAHGGAALTRVQTGYATAIAVQRPRTLARTQAMLLAEADQAGETFFYGWSAGKDRIEGPSVDCANAALRAWGNCAIEMDPVQETHDAWLFTAKFVDLESGFTISRQFRQSKRWQVFGKLDEERKMDVRFQIGQSKAIRNVVLNALPKWLTSKAVDQAKKGVRTKIEGYIEQKGIAAAVEATLKALAKHGVTEDRVLARFDVAKREALDIDMLVMLRGDISALDEGREFPGDLFPELEKEQPKGQTLAEKINPAASKQQEPKQEQSAPRQETAAKADEDHPPQEQEKPVVEELDSDVIATLDNFRAYYIAKAYLKGFDEEQAAQMFSALKIAKPITKLTEREKIAKAIHFGAWNFENNTVKE